MTLEFTTIQHTFRKHHALTCNEYILADMIYFLSTSPEARIKGWCYMSRPTMAEELGLSKQSILNLIAALVDKGFVIRQDVTSYLRTTQKWNVVYFKGGKESLPPVKKVYPSGKDTLPAGSTESLPNNNKEDNDSYTLSFPPNGVKGSPAVSGKSNKKRSPQVAPGPPDQKGSYLDQKPGQGEENNQSGNNIPSDGDNAAEGLKKPLSLYFLMIDKYDAWFKLNNDGQPPKFDGQQGKAAKAIITYLGKVVKAKKEAGNNIELEQGIRDAWALILDNWILLEPFYQKRTKLSEISSDLQNIIKQLKDGRIKKAGNGNTTATAQGVDNAITERLRAARAFKNHS